MHFSALSLYYLLFFFKYTRHSRHTCALYISINLVNPHHTYTRNPSCGGQARLVCLSNGVLLYVSEFSRYLINFSTIKYVNLKKAR